MAMGLRRSRIIVALLITAAGAAPASNPQPGSPLLEPGDHPFQRGVNVLWRDPYWEVGGEPRLRWRHFREIRGAGFDFVRVNLGAFKHMDEQHRLAPQWLAKLDTVVREAQAAGLGVIIDEHDFNPCSKDVATCRTRLSAFWRQVAPRYANAPRNVAFELLNEPHRKLTADVWNDLIAELLPIVRRTNPTRIVVVGPTEWYGVGSLPRLKLPADDRNLLVTFHYYKPFKFTHQGATWAGDAVKQLRGITWGSKEDRDALRFDFDRVSRWAAANRRPILLGEFGVYDKGGTPINLRVAYTEAVRSEAEKRRFGWTYWQFQGNFGVWDRAEQRWNKPILSALIPEAVSAATQIHCTDGKVLAAVDSRERGRQPTTPQAKSC